MSAGGSRVPEEPAGRRSGGWPTFCSGGGGGGRDARFAATISASRSSCLRVAELSCDREPCCEAATQRQHGTFNTPETPDCCFGSHYMFHQFVFIFGSDFISALVSQSDIWGPKQRLALSNSDLSSVFTAHLPSCCAGFGPLPGFMFSSMHSVTGFYWCMFENEVVYAADGHIFSRRATHVSTEYSLITSFLFGNVSKHNTGEDIKKHK